MMDEGGETIAQHRNSSEKKKKAEKKLRETNT
jgi:hypothetical protein